MVFTTAEVHAPPTEQVEYAQTKETISTNKTVQWNLSMVLTYFIEAVGEQNIHESLN